MLEYPPGASTVARVAHLLRQPRSIIDFLVEWGSTRPSQSRQRPPDHKRDSETKPVPAGSIRGISARALDELTSIDVEDSQYTMIGAFHEEEVGNERDDASAGERGNLVSEAIQGTHDRDAEEMHSVRVEASSEVAESSLDGREADNLSAKKVMELEVDKAGDRLAERAADRAAGGRADKAADNQAERAAERRAERAD